MPLTIEKTFLVRAPARSVWSFLTDPVRVARCMPGAAVTERLDDRTFAGTLVVKIGPVTVSYKGKLSFARLDAEARSAEIHASGQDVRGKGGARMKLASRLSERGADGTEVFASSEIEVTGMLAQMGRGMIQDVGEQIFRKFTDAMRAELEAPASAAPRVAEERSRAAGVPGRAAEDAAPAGAPQAQAAPLDVVSLGAGAAARAAGRTVQRPAFWIAAAALALAAIWLWLARSPVR